MQKIKNLPMLCGVIDAAIILVVALIIATAEGKPPKILLQQNPGIVFGFLLPLCMITAWRGTAQTKRLINGERGWLRPATEGFLVGFLPIPFIQTIGILREFPPFSGRFPYPGRWLPMGGTSCGNLSFRADERTAPEPSCLHSGALLP